MIYAGGNTGFYKSFDHGNTFGSALTLSSYVYSIAINPSAPTNIFVGTSASGVYKSANSGANFAATSQSFGEIQRLVIDPNAPSVLYASEVVQGRQYGVLQSQDGGATWNAANTGIPGYFGNQDINFLAVDPSHPGVVFAAATAGSCAPLWQNWIRQGRSLSIPIILAEQKGLPATLIQMTLLKELVLTAMAMRSLSGKHTARIFR